MSKLVGKLRDDAEMRLFCFPFGGGSGGSYGPWAKLLPAWLQVCPIHLPGRERRISEPAFADLVPAIPTLVADLLPALDRPYALFGHSMGALFAFEIARALETRGRKPRVLYASGLGSPDRPSTEPPIADLPDDQFLERLRRFGGAPEELFAHPKLRELAMPLLRADARLWERYFYTSGSTVSCPIDALGGSSDPSVPPESLEGWRRLTTGDFRCHLFPGDHFFCFGASQTAATAFLADDLTQRLRRTTA